MGGGIDLSAGVYVGFDGVGALGSASYTPGLGGDLGAGAAIGGYTSLDTLGGLGYGVKYEGPGVCFTGTTGPAGGLSGQVGVEPMAGLWAGGVVGTTVTVPLDYLFTTPIQ